MLQELILINLVYRVFTWSSVKLFLFLFYETAKILVWIIRWFFYAKRTLVNSGRRLHKGPCILVSNHPGTLMDPLNVAVLMKRRVNFLANASLFTTPFSNWFFSTFYCIKLERYKDTGGKPLRNEEAFRMATTHLTNGGCLYMAPEGESHSGRHLNKIKTGAARIALNTEQANGFALGLTIFPVGLNYSDPGQFRSHLLTVMGEPIQVADFKGDWEADQIKSVRKLTAHLKEHMAATLINAADKEEDQLLAKAEIILQNEKAISGAQLFGRSKEVLNKLQAWRSGKPDLYQSFKAKTDAYFQKLTSIGTSDMSVKGKVKAPIILIVLSVPFYLLGYLIHFLPAYFTKKMSDRLSTDPSWIPTYKVLGGLIIYPLTLILQYWMLRYLLFHFLEMGKWWKWIYIASIVPTGLLAEWFLEKWKLFRDNWRYHEFAKRQPKEKETLEQMREEVLSIMS